MQYKTQMEAAKNGYLTDEIRLVAEKAVSYTHLVYVQLLDNHFKEVYNNCHPRAKIG